jgi:hypothetical protein
MDGATLGLARRRAQANDRTLCGVSAMMTTANYMRPADPPPPPVVSPAKLERSRVHTAAERMAKARAAKAAKQAERLGMRVAQTPNETRIILGQLRDMFVPGSNGHELAGKALRLMEAQTGGSVPGDSKD